jgi:hypothetical protein
MASSNHSFDDQKIVKELANDPKSIIAESLHADVEFTPDAEEEGFYAYVTVTRRYKIPAERARDILRDAL